MSLGRVTSVLACLLPLAALGAGCGSSGSTESTTAPAAENRPAAPKSDFPNGAGRTLTQVLSTADHPSRLLVSPAAMVFYPGENRYPLGIFEKDGTPVNDAEVAIYLAKVPKPKSRKGKPGKASHATAEKRALDEPAIGPIPAAVESLSTEPAYRALTTTSEPDAATSVYVTHVDFPSDGEWRIAALIKEGNETGAALLPSALVGEFTNIPRVGQKPPLIHTPTAADVGGDLGKITTRRPPDTQNQIDYAEALGKKPIILLFATPKFCQSRVCGPVVDVAEQVKQRYGSRVAFIHMEIYNENDPEKGVRPQVRAFHLPSEPWLFAIDRRGVVRAEIEGAFGVTRLTRIVRGLVRE
jgi:hypothetical protein